MDPQTDRIASVSDLLDVLQLAREGGPELDRQIEPFLPRDPRRADDADADDDDRPGRRSASKRWSTDVMALLDFIPKDHNFSLGERDGVVWSWIQPNDNWQQGEHESRHDHPAGSGLVVAHTVPLALAAAIVKLACVRPGCVKVDGVKAECVKGGGVKTL